VAQARRARAASGRRRGTSARSGWLAGADRPALLLLAAWIGYRLYPFLPSLDPGKYWRAIRPVLAEPLPHGSDPFRLCLMWLLCCMLVEATAGPALAVRAYPLLAAAIFAAKVLVIDNAVTSGDVAGACVAFGLWLLVFRRAPARHAILAAFFVALLIAMRLPPPRGFDWPAMLERAYLYGGLIWLLMQAGMRLTYATVATALFVLAIGVAAAHGHVRPAELTGPGVALGLGALFYGVAFSLPRRSRP
jgi:hypothetical protein